MLSRWFSLLVLGVLSLGPGLFWSSNKSKVGEGFSTGWASVPLPQHSLEAKSKFQSLSLGLALAALLGIQLGRKRPIYRFSSSYQSPFLGKPLYLEFSKLQTDGG